MARTPFKMKGWSPFTAKKKTISRQEDQPVEEFNAKQKRADDIQYMKDYNYSQSDEGMSGDQNKAREVYKRMKAHEKKYNITY